MKIYTQTGDEGSTALLGGQRVAKDHPRLRAFGAVDEFNAHLGVARAAGLPEDLDALVERLQNEMFALGAELASTDSAKSHSEFLGEADVTRLENDIDAYDERLPELKQFVLPAGTPGAAALHVARCVCRRAERETVGLTREASVRPLLLKYLNRIGDLLFVLARSANARAGVADAPWQKPTA